MPGAIWLSYNLFRLIAVVFLTWALVAQFLSLTDEVTLYNSTRNNTTTSTVESSNFSVPGSATVSITSSIGVAKIGEMVLTSTSIIMPSITTTPVSRMTSALTPVTSTTTTIGPVHVGLQPLVGSENDIRRRTVTSKREEEILQSYPTEVTSSMYKSIRGDRIVWIVISRIAIAVILGVCGMAQLGVPEVFLYKHLGLLGPQSTPSALGGIQTLVAVQSLRAEAKDINLIPSYCVFGIGLFNILIAILLLYLGRNLPKIPAPPLYFNHATRLLFWKPAPSFYADALNPALPTTRRNTPSPPTLPPDHDIKSNAPEIGMDDTDEDEWEMVTKPKSNPNVAPLYKARRIEGARDIVPEQDVRTGGYPTFSGNGIGAMNRHVPRGFMETDKAGMPISLKIETDDMTSVNHGQLIVGKAQTGQPKEHSRIENAAQMARLAKPLYRERPAWTFEAIQADLDQPDTLYRETLPPAIPSQPPISRSLSNRSTKSDISAYDGLEKEGVPRLPWKLDTNGVQTTSTSTSDGVIKYRHTSGRAKSPSEGKRERSRPTLKPAAKPKSEPRNRELGKQNDPKLEVIPRIGEQLVDEAVSIDGKNAHSAHAEAPLTAAISPLITVSIVQAQKGQKSLSHTYVRSKSKEDKRTMEERQSTCRPEKAKSMVLKIPSTVVSERKVKRSSSVMESRDRSRGVRFNLSVVEEISEPEYSPSPAPTPQPPSAGLRIPGTNLIFPLPAILSPRPALSTAKAVEENAVETRPESPASMTEIRETLESEMASHRERLLEQNSEKEEGKAMVLGGKYLSGGSELEKA